MHHETYHWSQTVSDPWCGPDLAYAPWKVRALARDNQTAARINAENYALSGLAIYIMNTFNLKEVPYQSAVMSEGKEDEKDGDQDDVMVLEERPKGWKEPESTSEKRFIPHPKLGFKKLSDYGSLEGPQS
ncbi:hypothetical protein IL306_004036, partial [Fusarium sp. DS 682]